jgi:hypothetical protein
LVCFFYWISFSKDPILGGQSVSSFHSTGVIMKNVCLVLGLLAQAFLSSSCLAQLDVVDSKIQVVTGLKGVQAVGDILIIDEASQPKFRAAVVLEIATDSKFVDVEAYDPVTNIDADVIQVGDSPKLKRFIIAGDGKIRVVITAFDPGIKKKRLNLDFGPPAPPPNPEPSPGPSPEPANPLPQGFDGLASKVKEWSKGLPKKKEVAAVYRSCAVRLLTPQGTISSISAELVAARTSTLGDTAPYSKLLENIHADLVPRWLGINKAILSDYWNCIAAGLEAP